MKSMIYFPKNPSVRNIFFRFPFSVLFNSSLLKNPFWVYSRVIKTANQSARFLNYSFFRKMGDYTFLQQPAIFTFDFGGRRKANVPMCRCDDVPMCRCADEKNTGSRLRRDHLSFVACHLSSVIRHPSSVICHPPSSAKAGFGGQVCHRKSFNPKE